MRKSRIGLAIMMAMSLLGSTVTLAQQRLKVGDWAPDFDASDWVNVAGEDEIPSIIKCRGLAVVVFFWTSWHDGGKFILPYVNLIASQNYGTDAGVMMIGLTDADLKTTKSLLAEEKILFPVGVNSKSAKQQYGFENSWGVVVIDTEGKIAYLGEPSNISGWQQQIFQILGKAPPYRTHPDNAKRIIMQVANMRQAVAKRDYRRVYFLLRECLEKSVVGDKLTTEVAGYGDLIAQQSYLQIREAQFMAEKGDYAKAAEALRQTHRRSRGFPPSQDAKKLIDAYAKEFDGFKAASDTYEGEEKAYKLLLLGRQSMEDKRVGEAEEKFSKVLSEYPKTEAAKIAQGYVDRMKAIPEVWREVLNYRAREDCSAWMQLAQQAIKQGKKKEAEELYRRILDKHPGTTYADDAKEALKKL